MTVHLRSRTGLSGRVWPVSRPETARLYPGYGLSVPKKDQKRQLSSSLRDVVAANVRSLKGAESATQLGKRSGLGRRTVDRLLESDNAATLDTIEALAQAFGVEPWQLLLKSYQKPVVITERPRKETPTYSRRDKKIPVREE